MSIANLNQPTGVKTEFLLTAISSRLSGREDCRKTVYHVVINHLGVNMSPCVLVWPNRYCKRESDKIDIISWVHNYKMPQVDLSELVFGTYEYQLSAGGKQRKWRKIK